MEELNEGGTLESPWLDKYQKQLVGAISSGKLILSDLDMHSAFIFISHFLKNEQTNQKHWVIWDESLEDLEQLRMASLDPGELQDDDPLATVPVSEGLNNLYQKKWAFYHEAILGNRNLRHLIQRYLGLRSYESVGSLDAILDEGQFQMTTQEYYQLKGVVKKSEQLFHPDYPLLQKKFKIGSNFLTKSTQNEEPQKEQFQLIQKWIEQTNGIQVLLYQLMSRYKEEILSNLEGQFTLLANQILSLQERMKKGQKLYGEEFESISTVQKLGAKIKSPFSKTHQELDEEKKEIRSQFLSLVQTIRASPFSHLVGEYEDLNMLSISRALDSYIESLSAWREVAISLSQEKLERLNKANLDQESKLQEAILDLEHDWEHLLDEINSHELFKDKIEHNSVSFSKRRHELSSLSSDLMEAYHQLSHYPDFIQWLEYFRSLDDRSRNLISELSKLDSLNWEELFEYWYLKKLIEKHCYIEHNLWMLKDAEISSGLKIWDKNGAVSIQQLRNRMISDSQVGIIRKLSENNEPSQIFILGWHPGYREILEIIKDTDSVVLFHHPATVDIHRLELNLKVEKHAGATLYPSFYKDLMRQDRLEFLNEIKNFSRALFRVLAPCTVMQSKDRAIFIKGNPETILPLVATEQDYKIQTIDSESGQDLLTDTLLAEDRELLLIVQDYLLHDDWYQNATWIHILQSAGISILSFDHLKLFKHPRAYFSEFKASIHTKSRKQHHI